MTIMATIISAEALQVGDTIAVWWNPNRDTITALRPYADRHANGQATDEELADARYAAARYAAAQKAGKPRNANPYKPRGDGSLHSAWDVGWMLQQNEAKPAARRRYSRHVLGALRILAGESVPRNTFNPGVVDALTREALAELVPGKDCRGSELQYLSITEAGRAALSSPERIRP
jgi:hypothetical protein